MVNEYQEIEDDNGDNWEGLNMTEDNEPVCLEFHCPVDIMGRCNYPRCFSPSNIP